MSDEKLPDYVTSAIYFNDEQGTRRAVGIWNDELWFFLRHPDDTNWVSSNKVGTAAHEAAEKEMDQ